MSIAQGMAAELQHELAVTKTYFERVPEDQLAYKPHEKSMSLQQLVGHLAEISQWVGATITEKEFNFDPTQYVPFLPGSRAEAIAALEANGAGAIEVLNGASDATMFENWRMTMGEQVLFEMPRVAVVRSMMISHIVHHRAQLGVYLRLLDVPVPKTYGPTADEQ